LKRKIQDLQEDYTEGVTSINRKPKEKQGCSTSKEEKSTGKLWEIGGPLVPFEKTGWEGFQPM